MKTIKSKMGTMYYERTKEKNAGFDYVLLDSNKEFISNIIEKNTINAIKECDHPNMLFSEILGEFVCYAQSKEDLVDEVNSVIKEDNEKFEYNDPLLSLEDLEDNGYYNQIGVWHIFFMN